MTPKSAKEREKFEKLFQSRHGPIHTVDKAVVII